VAPGAAPPGADLICLPGSKSLRADLDRLRGQGWDSHLNRHLRYGGKVIAICGGFQMLGRGLHDPLGVEGGRGSSSGLGLLDLETTLARDKELRNVSGRLAWCDARVRGYEIHAGVTTGPAVALPSTLLEHGPDGAISADEQVLGSYVHGIFDQPEACDALLAWAGYRAGGATDIAARRDADLDRLADAVETHLDTAPLAALFGLEEAGGH
jgi:adenosylcobyric acid synthase